jgi:hypothetical protein
MKYLKTQGPKQKHQQNIVSKSEFFFNGFTIEIISIYFNFFFFFYFILFFIYLFILEGGGKGVNV